MGDFQAACYSKACPWLWGNGNRWSPEHCLPRGKHKSPGNQQHASFVIYFFSSGLTFFIFVAHTSSDFLEKRKRQADWNAVILILQAVLWQPARSPAERAVPGPCPGVSRAVRVWRRAPFHGHCPSAGAVLLPALPPACRAGTVRTASRSRHWAPASPTHSGFPAPPGARAPPAWAEPGPRPPNPEPWSGWICTERPPAPTWPGCGSTGGWTSTASMPTTGTSSKGKEQAVCLFKKWNLSKLSESGCFF